MFGIAEVTKSSISRFPKSFVGSIPSAAHTTQLYSCSNTISAGVVLFGDGAMWSPSVPSLDLTDFRFDVQSVGGLPAGPFPSPRASTAALRPGIDSSRDAMAQLLAFGA